MVSRQKMISRLPDKKFKKMSYCPLQILALNTFSQEISKTITASSLNKTLSAVKG